MFRKYSGYGNANPGVLIVATSLPVLGVSPSAGVAGAAVFGGGSCFTSVGFGGALGGGAGALTGLEGLGATGAGFSSGGGVGSASRASRFCEGAGAATRSTAYEGGEALVGLTVVNRKLIAAACTAIVPTSPAARPGGSRSELRILTAILPRRLPVPRSALPPTGSPPAPGQLVRRGQRCPLGGTPRSASWWQPGSGR